MSLSTAQPENSRIPPRIALVDWLGFTLRFDEKEFLQSICVALERHFDISRDNWEYTKSGWFGYKHKISLGKYGLIAHGGSAQKGTVHVEITGTGCSLVTNWDAVSAWLESKKAKLTRLDLAHDDFTGEVINIQNAKSWREEGLFSSTGRIPDSNFHDDMGSGKGCTLYVGNRANGKLCRVYEKGKQLGDKHSPWNRVEVEWRSRDRVIPYLALKNPSAFLAGAYPCLNYLCAEQSVIQTRKKAFEHSLDRMKVWLKTCAGPSLHALCEINGGDAVEVLAQTMRPCPPKRLEAYKTPSSHGGERYPVLDQSVP